MHFKDKKTYLVRQVLYSETALLEKPIWVSERVSIESALWAIEEGLADSHFLDPSQACQRVKELNK